MDKYIVLLYYVYKIKYFILIKINELYLDIKIWRNFSNIILSEKNKLQKIIYIMIFFFYKFKVIKNF